MPGDDLTAPLTTNVIKARQMTIEAYRPYGNIISAGDSVPFKPANNGTARRFNHLCNLENLRKESAQLNVCIFRCQPTIKLPLEIKLLEKHPYSTQAFLPMSTTGRYLTVVALGGETPDLSTLAVFITEGAQGVSYKPGVWHYPMTVLEEQLDFTCLIHEDGSPDDCIIYSLSEPFLIDLAK